MSSQGHHNMAGIRIPPKAQKNEIELTERFSEQMAQLYLNDAYSDVEFIVDGNHLPAHRVILAARSEYFRAMLYGGLSESNQRKIYLEKIPLKAFKILLKYIYSGHLSLSNMDESFIIEILGLANLYGFTELELAISKYLREHLALNNICLILDAARLYNLEKLTKECLIFMDRSAAEVLQHDSFKTLTKESLEEVLRRDSFFAPEVQIFLSVWEWCKHNTEVDIKSVLSNVRLPLIDLEHLLKVVRPSNILDPNKLLDAIEEQNTSTSLPYRAALWPDENVATSKYQSRTMQGECRASLLDGDVTSYDMEKGYTRHCITDDQQSGIVVELGTMCIINHIKLLLWDRDSRAYSYFIEISGNLEHWERVIDYSKFHCRSWQFLYFPARPVRYIRLVGTHNTVNKVFHVVALEAMYTATMPKVIDGFVVPTTNVATIEMSAMVIDGVSRTRNALINGDYINYDWDSGYTCHQLGSGEIAIRLGQPYYVGSMRLLLWDCDDRTYSFYIETSTNQKTWQIVVDKRNENASSWQHFVFTPRPVVFIRIVGTRNTANEAKNPLSSQIFHCVHLECPSQDPNYLQAEKEKLRASTSNSKINAIATAVSSATAAACATTLASSSSSVPATSKVAMPQTSTSMPSTVGGNEQSHCSQNHHSYSSRVSTKASFSTESNSSSGSSCSHHSRNSNSNNTQNTQRRNYDGNPSVDDEILIQLENCAANSQY